MRSDMYGVLERMVLCIKDVCRGFRVAIVSCGQPCRSVLCFVGLLVPYISFTRNIMYTYRIVESMYYMHGGSALQA